MNNLKNYSCCKSPPICSLLIIFLVFLFYIFTLFSLQTQAQAFPSKPYKANSVDECINEKNCLKYVFLHEIIRDYEKHSTKQNFTLERWQGSVSIGIIGLSRSIEKKVNDYGISSIAVTKEIDIYFPHPLQITDDKVNMNVVILFGEDLNSDILEKRKDLLTFFSSEFLEIIKSEKRQYPKVIKISKGHVFNEGAILIEQVDNQNNCYFGLLTNLLGINEYNSSAFGLTDYDDCSATNLHKLILSIMYSRKMKPGINVHDIDNVFEDFYNNLLDTAKAHNMKPSELVSTRISLSETGKYTTTEN